MRFCLFSTLFLRFLHHLLLHIYLPGLTKALWYKNWNVTLSPPKSWEQQLAQSSAKYQVLMTGVKVNRRRLWMWTAAAKKSDFPFCVFLKSSTSVCKCCCCCSVTKSCLTLCDSRDCSTPGFSVPHRLPDEFAQTHAHWVSNAIQPSCPLLRDFPGGPVVKTSPSNAGGAGLIPDQEAKIPYALWPRNQNIKQKQYCKKFNKDFKNGPH